MRRLKNKTAVWSLALGALLPLTVAATAGAATAPPLGTAASFSILAGSQIDNVPTSVINGNVGLSPAAGSFVNGLTCLEVTGTIYVTDLSGDPCFISNPGLLTTAKSDLVLAFDDAAAQTPTMDITGVNLAGQTYGPGVYSATSDILLSGPVPLTLNGGGNADSVFIFKAAAGQDLTVDPTSQVNYTNGAQPCNVFWKVQSAFLANTGFGFVGTIMALTQITLTANITVQGRLLARNADVTLDQDTITRPTTCVRQADIDAATAAAAAAEAEAARVEAERVATEAAAVEAARVVADKAAAAAKAAKAKAAKAAATRKLAAAKAAAAKRAAALRVRDSSVRGPAVPSRGDSSVRGPALPPVNPRGFTG